MEAVPESAALAAAACAMGVIAEKKRRHIPVLSLLCRVLYFIAHWWLTFAQAFDSFLIAWRDQWSQFRGYQPENESILDRQNHT